MDEILQAKIVNKIKQYNAESLVFTNSIINKMVKDIMQLIEKNDRRKTK